MRRLWRHWVGDARTRYIDPRDGELKPERRQPWQAVGPGQLVLYALVIAALVGGGVYVHSVDARFTEQHRRSDCIRVALRPIVVAAARLGGGPALLHAERAYLRATVGLNAKGC